MLSRSGRIAARSTSINPLVTSNHVLALRPYSSHSLSQRRLPVSLFLQAAARRPLSQLVHQVQRETGTPTSLNIESLPLLASNSTTAEPLRILFCGSDALSASVLRALHSEHLSNPTLIESLSVFHRPGKATGRGLKKRTIPVLKTVAEELGIPESHIHEKDTFTGWTPPLKPEINLIIAVSFGLFVPPRILSGAKYRGLNIHPSLLPDLRGCSPIQSAILHQDSETGITLQDLNPKVFDHGKLLARLRMPIPRKDEITNEELTNELAEPAAQLLIHGLRNGLYQPDRAQELPEPDLGHPPREAKKMQKLDMQLKPDMTASQVSAVKRALGQVWFVRQLGEDKKPSEVRILLDELSVAPMSPVFSEFLSSQKNENDTFRPLSMKQQLADGTEKSWTRPMMKSSDFRSIELYLGGDSVLKIGSATVSGGKKTTAIKAIWGKEGDGQKSDDGLGVSWFPDILSTGIIGSILH